MGNYEEITLEPYSITALLPCPFCGGEYHSETDTVYHAVTCALSVIDSDQLTRITSDAWNIRFRVGK